MGFWKAMIGSYLGAIIGIWMCKWLGWVPNQHDIVAERFFVKNWREIVHGLLCISAALTVGAALLIFVYAIYRLARSIQ